MPLIGPVCGAGLCALLLWSIGRLATRADAATAPGERTAADSSADTGIIGGCTEVMVPITADPVATLAPSYLPDDLSTWQARP